MAAKKTKNNQSGTAIGIMVVGAMILVIAVVLILTQGGASQPAAQVPAEDIPYPAVDRVSLEDAKAAYDQGEAVFVDVRSVDSYQAAHVTGALSIPLAELEGRLAEIPQDKWIITYCTWPAEETSARAAQILMDRGYTKTSAILGGLQPWMAAGYPVESGN